MHDQPKAPNCSSCLALATVCRRQQNFAPLIKAISGVFQYDEGDIYLDGKRVAFATPQEAHKTPQCCRGHD